MRASRVFCCLVFIVTLCAAVLNENAVSAESPAPSTGWTVSMCRMIFGQPDMTWEQCKVELGKKVPFTKK